MEQKVAKEISDEDDFEEVNDMTEKRHMVEHQDFQSKLKHEKGVIAKKNQAIQKLNNDIVEKNVLIETLHKNIDTCAREKTVIHNQLSETSSKCKLCELEIKKAKPIEGEIYVPPLILESKISELENTLEEERILIGLEQMVFSTVFINTDFSNTSKASISNDDDVLFDEEFDSLNSDGCFDKYVKNFDCNAKLPDHSQFIVNFNGLPSVYEKGESSTKVDKKVSVSTYYAKDLKKRKPEMKPEWRPKKKIDEATKSFFDSECNRVTDNTRHMWYFDSGCSKHMTGQKDILSKYIEKLCGNVRFGNDQFSPILGYGDVVQENLTIKKVSYVEGLEHNLFSIGKFCDKDLEVNFKAKRCYVRTEDGKEFLVGMRMSNLYTINLQMSRLIMRCVYFQKPLCNRVSYGLPELKCFVLNDKENLNKFSPKDDEGIFIGYSQTSAAYRVYMNKSKIVVESVNVTFDEEMASDQISSEPIITGVLASGQISPEPAVKVSNSDKASTFTSHLIELDLLFDHFYDEFLGSKVTKHVVIDRSKDSSNHHTITSDVSTKSNSSIQEETPVQTPTQSIEVAHDNAELEVAHSIGYTVMPTQQTLNVSSTETSAPVTSPNPYKKKILDI
ncbi:hypothetical protein L6452_02135 [Arctium lappa]|uniref:Uncharacterized protein n=1 Tax=Arctium lappa TaxID=4217 RepID=A0ACB9FJH1_ARCLA|nr:hypothetical protein L6452_02135 [Arctium lappa]